MVDQFLTHLEHEKRYSKNTLESYATDLNQFSAYLQEEFPDFTLSNAGFKIVRSWIYQLSEDELSPRSINRKIACLKSYYKYLRRQGVISVDPTLKIKALKSPKRLPTFVEESNLAQLLDQFEFEDAFEGFRDKIVLEILYGTGMRLSELINLKLNAIDLKRQEVKVLGKGNKERIIPIHSNLVREIKIYLESRKDIKEGNTTGWFNRN